MLIELAPWQFSRLMPQLAFDRHHRRIVEQGEGSRVKVLSHF